MKNINTPLLMLHIKHISPAKIATKMNREGQGHSMGYFVLEQDKRVLHTAVISNLSTKKTMRMRFEKI